jgi:6-pyruvoyltetrahydropterin/6-carboxytetrahydropterin synthase
MDRYSVTQQIHFCYGHRLLEYAGKCAHLHGHNVVAELTFETSSLDPCGMVIDFNEIKSKLKSWIDTHLDHKMLLRSDDPMADLLSASGEPIYRMEGNPTAENIARLLFDRARSLGLPVIRAELRETPTQFATYRES